MRRRYKRNRAIISLAIGLLSSHIILSERSQTFEQIYSDAYDYSEIDEYGDIHMTNRLAGIDFHNMISTLSYSPNITITGGYIIDDPQADYLNEPSVFPNNFRTKPIRKIENRKHQYIPVISSNRDDSTGKSDYNHEKNVQVFDNIRISLDTYSLENFVSSIDYTTQIDSVLNSMLPQAISLWEARLSVIYPPEGNLILSEETCGPANVPEEHRTNGIADSDLLIYVLGEECMSTEENLIYAYGAPCQYDEYYRPIAGYLVVCLNDISVIDGAVSGNEIRVNSYIHAHEMGHILGFMVDLFEYYYNFDTGTIYGTLTKNVTCVDGTSQTLEVPRNLREIQVNGASFFELISHAVVNIAKNQFRCEKTTVGVRLASDYESCFGSSHWSERIIDEDLMSPLTDDVIYNSLDSAITPFTLAALEDSGWYKANYTLSSERTFGSGAGCDFLTEPCIVNGDIPAYSSGFFCNDTIPFIDDEPDPLTIQYGCDVDHIKKAVCDLVNYSEPPANNSGLDPPPDSFQYFDSPNLGAYFNTGADYCPRVKDYMSIDCTDVQQETSFSYDDLGPNSRCFETNLRQAVCLTAGCNAETGKIEGYLLNNNQQFVCDYDGQLIDYEVIPAESSFKFICPRVDQFCRLNSDQYCPSSCSGRGICTYNDTISYCECNDESDTSDDCSLSVTQDPVLIASDQPSNYPSLTPSSIPSLIPSSSPSSSPSDYPSSLPTESPTSWPTFIPTTLPTLFPTVAPSVTPSVTPSTTPSGTPSVTPSFLPSDFGKKKMKKKSYKNSSKVSKKESSESQSIKQKKDSVKSSISIKKMSSESKIDRIPIYESSFQHFLPTTIPSINTPKAPDLMASPSTDMRNQKGLSSPVNI